MKNKVLIGYSGSWAFGLSTFYKMEELKEKLTKTKNKKAREKINAEIKKIKKMRAEHGQPVYVSKAKYKKLKAFKELQNLSVYL